MRGGFEVTTSFNTPGTGCSDPCAGLSIFLKRLPPGCDAHAACRGCSMENTIGNHVKMCFLEDFPMLSTQIFLA